jgi:alkanesulfonate monooxygenase SsuD/methylene tetrahydromethanopterin reductase-like flavin-dependent oxidoreductase (luciferase family)
MKVVFVADTMEQARKLSEPYVEMLYEYVGGVPRRPIFEDPGTKLRESEMTQSWWDFLWKKDQLYIGTPDSVSEQIARMREEFNPDDLLVYTWIPGMPQRDVLRSMELFAGKVMPRFADAKPAASETLITTAGATR